MFKKQTCPKTVTHSKPASPARDPSRILGFCTNGRALLFSSFSAIISLEEREILALGANAEAEAIRAVRVRAKVFMVLDCI
jgi:hypothetical protein